MNSKLLIVIITLMTAFGTFIFLENKKSSPTPTPSIQSKESTETVPTPNNPIVTVTLTDSGFTPKDIAVKTGTRVIWKNSSGKTATVSSNDHPTHRLYPFLNLGEFADGSSVQVVFDKAGKYSYHDHYNASQTGTVTVE